MTNDITIEVDTSKMTTELRELVILAYKEKPNHKDLLELKRKMQEIPDLWKWVFDLSKVIRNNLVEKAVTPKAARLAIEKNVEELMEGMGYSGSSELEKLLIENIIITWLRLQWTDYQLVSSMGEDNVRFSVLDFWEKRLSVSQKRFLRACETLARVRRLLFARPPIQVNIATRSGKQVNIAGDVLNK